MTRDELVERLSVQLCYWGSECRKRSRVGACCKSEQAGNIATILSEIDACGLQIVPKEMTPEMWRAGWLSEAPEEAREF